MPPASINREIRDLLTGTAELVFAAYDGGSSSGYILAASSMQDISADGHHNVFSSGTDDLVPSDFGRSIRRICS